MENVPRERDTDESPSLVAQHYQLLHEAEIAEASRQRFARRRFLRRSALVVGGLVIVSGGAGALSMLYPTLDGQFGGTIDLGPKALFPAATPDNFKLNQAGVFYHESARAFLVHLARETRYLLAGNSLANELLDQRFTRDTDGSYWLALYQRCTHLGATMAFRNDCAAFKCPSHGAHYLCDGEYLDGPAPRSMDRFPLSLNGDRVRVDTGQLLPGPGHGDTPRLLPIPQDSCMS